MRGTVHKFIDEGGLPAYRFGRVIRLKQTDVDAFIESCRVQPGDRAHLRHELVQIAWQSSGVDCATATRGTENLIQSRAGRAQTQRLQD